MAVAAEERLVVALEAKIRDFEKNMQKARKTANDNLAGIERRASQSGKTLEASLVNAGKGLSAGLAMGLGLVGIGGAGIAGVVAGIKAAVTDVAAMSAEAKRAGVGVEAFQELKYAAEQARVGVDGLTDGLKEMQLRADEFILTGAGSGAEAFQRLGFTAEDLKEKLQDPAALFQEIIGKLRDLDKASQIRVSDEIFGGTGGEQFVRFLEQGSNAIASARKEARDTGSVLDAEMVKRAEEIDRKFQALATTIGTNVKGAVLSLLDALREFGPALQQSLKVVNDAPSVALAKTDQELAGMRAQLAQHQATRNYAVIGDLEKRIAEVEKRRDAVAESVRESSRAAAMSNRDGTAPAGPDVPLPTARPQGLAGQGDTSHIKKAGETTEKITRGYDELRAAALARLTDLQTEQAALGMTTQAAEAYRFEQQTIAEATRMQITLTPQQLTDLHAVAAQYGKLSVAIENNRQKQASSMQLQQELGSIASSTISGLIDGTQSWGDALANVAKRFADLALQAALLGDGPLGGMFGNPATSSGAGGLIGGLFKAFSSGHAAGGLISGPGTGRSDSIMARLSNGEYVVNAAATAKNRGLLDSINSGRIPKFADGGIVGGAVAASAKAAGTRIVMGDTNITVQGNADQDAIKQIRSELERHRQQMPGIAVMAVMTGKRNRMPGL